MSPTHTLNVSNCLKMRLIALKMSSHNNMFVCSQHASLYLLWVWGHNSVNSASTLCQAMWAAIAEAVGEHDVAHSHHPKAPRRSTREGRWWIGSDNDMQMGLFEDRVVNQNRWCQAQPLIRIIQWFFLFYQINAFSRSVYVVCGI